MFKTANTNLTTVGNGTLLVAALVGQLITRSGPTGAFTDTIDTAANFQAYFRGMYNVTEPIQWVVTYNNTTSYVATIAAGAGGTVNASPGATVNIPAGAVAELMVSFTPLGSGSVTVTVLNRTATE